MTEARTQPVHWLTHPLVHGVLILAWAAALELILWRVVPGLWISGVIAVLLGITAFGLVSRMPGIVRGLLMAWVCVTSAVLLLIAAGNWLQQLVIAASVLVVLLTFLAERKSSDPILQGRLAAITVMFVLAASYIALLTFGAGIYVVIQPWWLALSAAGVTVAVSALAWSAADIPLKRYVRILPLAAVFGAELFFVIWWLPTLVYVGALIATMMTSLWLQTIRHVWLGDWELGRGRRYLLVGGSLTILLLATARWY